MKNLKRITGIVLLLLLLQTFGYLNILSNERGVSIWKTGIEINSSLDERKKQKELLIIQTRSEELKTQKRNTKIIIVIILFVFIVLLVVLVKKIGSSNIDDANISKE